MNSSKNICAISGTSYVNRYTCSPNSWTLRYKACVQWKTHPCITAHGNRSWMARHMADSKSTTNPCREICRGRSRSMARRIYKYLKSINSLFPHLLSIINIEQNKAKCTYILHNNPPSSFLT